MQPKIQLLEKLEKHTVYNFAPTCFTFAFKLSSLRSAHLILFQSEIKIPLYADRASMEPKSLYISHTVVMLSHLMLDTVRAPL